MPRETRKLVTLLLVNDRPVPATMTDRSDERHAETAGSVESHIGPPTPSLLVLHPGAPQRHSQIYRWLTDGFLTGEQLTAGAPWRIRIDQALRDRITPTVPEGWVGLADAAKVLGIARQTVLHKVQRGELDAVHVNQGRRKGLRINVNTEQDGLFDQPR